MFLFERRLSTPASNVRSRPATYIAMHCPKYTVYSWSNYSNTRLMLSNPPGEGEEKHHEQDENNNLPGVDN